MIVSKTTNAAELSLTVVCVPLKQLLTERFLRELPTGKDNEIDIIDADWSIYPIFIISKPNSSFGLLYPVLFDRSFPGAERCLGGATDGPPFWLRPSALAFPSRPTANGRPCVACTSSWRWFPAGAVPFAPQRSLSPPHVTATHPHPSTLCARPFFFFLFFSPRRGRVERPRGVFWAHSRRGFFCLSSSPLPTCPVWGGGGQPRLCLPRRRGGPCVASVGAAQHCHCHCVSTAPGGGGSASKRTPAPGRSASRVSGRAAVLDGVGVLGEERRSVGARRLSFPPSNT